MKHYLHHSLLSMVSLHCCLHRQNEGSFYISSHNMLYRKPHLQAFATQSFCVHPSFTSTSMLLRLFYYIQTDIGHLLQYFDFDYGSPAPCQCAFYLQFLSTSALIPLLSQIGEFNFFGASSIRQETYASLDSVSSAN